MGLTDLPTHRRISNFMVTLRVCSKPRNFKTQISTERHSANPSIHPRTEAPLDFDKINLKPLWWSSYIHNPLPSPGEQKGGCLPPVVLSPVLLLLSSSLAVDMDMRARDDCGGGIQSEDLSVYGGSGHES